MLARKGAAVKLTSPSDLMVYNKLIEYKSKIHSCQEKAYKLQIQTNTWGVELRKYIMVMHYHN